MVITPDSGANAVALSIPLPTNRNRLSNDELAQVSRPTRFSLLEPIRGLAALWVFCFHFPFSMTFRESLPGLYAIFRVGDLGVPMFFVVSGYCISAAAASTIARGTHWSTFLWRRVKRIYPTYWLSIGVVVLLPFISEFISSFRTGTYNPPTAENVNYGYLAFDWLDWILVASLGRVFQEFPDGSSLSAKFTAVNAVYWTLAIEVQFYLAVTALLLFRGKAFDLALVTLTIVSFASLLVPAMHTSGVFLPYWPMFVCGVLLHRVLAHHRHRRPLTSWSIVPIARMICGIALPCVFLIYVSRGGTIPYTAFAVFFVAFMYLLADFDDAYATMCNNSKLRVVRIVTQVFAILGSMSYSLYLLHGRLQFLIIQVTRQVVAADTIACDVISILSTCVLCFLFYLLCERPFVGTSSQVVSSATGG